MTFQGPDGEDCLNDRYVAYLPREQCAACRDRIQHQTHRVYVRATWRPTPDTLCMGCWRVFVEWAKRFALDQVDLPL